MRTDAVCSGTHDVGVRQTCVCVCVCVPGGGLRYLVGRVPRPAAEGSLHGVSQATSEQSVLLLMPPGCAGGTARAVCARHAMRTTVLRVCGCIAVGVGWPGRPTHHCEATTLSVLRRSARRNFKLGRSRRRRAVCSNGRRAAIPRCAPAW